MCFNLKTCFYNRYLINKMLNNVFNIININTIIMVYIILLIDQICIYAMLNLNLSGKQLTIKKKCNITLLSI